MKDSLIIILFFLLGISCGIFHLIPLNIAESDVSFYVLCGLMFCVGLSIGNDPQTLINFRMLNPRLVFLPIATILGTLSAAALVSLILPHRSVTDCMAVGSGLGYYSLSSIFITEYKALSWVPSPCFPTLCVRSLLYSARHYWYVGLAILLPSLPEAPLRWTPPCRSSPAMPDSHLWSFPSSTAL